MIEQLQQTECGLCCVAMILGYYGCHVKLGELRHYYEIGRDGIKINEINSLFSTYGVKSKIYKTSFDSINSVNCPCIVFWENKHFVIIEDINKKRKRVRIADPATGKYTISYDDAKKRYSGYLVLATPDKNFKKNKKKPNVWFKYGYLLIKNKKLFLSILLLSIISYLFTLLIPISIQKVIDSVNKGDISMLLNNRFQFILLILSVCSIYVFTLFLSGIRKISFAKYIDKEIAEKLFAHLLKLPVKFFELRSHGDILFRIQSLSIIRDMFTQKIVAFLMNCGTIFIMLVYIFIQSKSIAGVAIGFFVFSGFAIVYTRRRILETNQSEISETSKLQTIQSEMIYSITNIKLAGTEDDIYAKWKKQFNKNLNKHAETLRYSNIHNTLISALNQIGPLIILIMGIVEYISKILSIGNVVALYSAGSTFMSLCVSVFTSFDDFLLSSQYLERINEILEEKEEAYLLGGMEIKCDGRIRLQDVNFAFTNHSEPVLKDISLTIEPKQKVAFVGASGSGKSTLGKVLMGLYTPTEGNIFYNDINIKDLNIKNIRKQMGAVPQDIILLNESIYDNIKMSRENISKEMVVNATEISQVKSEIESMPMKYNTMVSDMGTNISGGQRQRIAFARAIVNSPTILVLDEATSSLDTINESRISSHLKNMGCTRVVIAHRMSTIIDSDIIYVLKDGYIVEQGNHESLMRKGGVYRQLYNKQAMDDISMENVI